jgi:hypothetical protein
MMKRVGSPEQIADLEEFAFELVRGVRPHSQHSVHVRRLAEEAHKRALLLQILRVFEDA